MADIILEHVSKKYNNEYVIRDFTYTFVQGNIYFVMGASGVGKTTLLRIIMGLTAQDSGNVQMNSQLSAVFQENRIVEELSPLTNVKMVLKGVKEELICRELKKVLPKSCFNRKCSELSGGMKRRVAIVRAMMAQSEAVIMDEPFTGLDAASKEMVMDYILEQRKARTLIIVSHDQSDAVFMKGEICLLTSIKPVATIT